ncbi:MAG TPA: ATP-binding cassette domain-containing protein [Acidimicrobiales bacterium]
MSAVVAEALCAGYGAGPVVDAVDLVVEPGEVVAVLGANGAGKSTLLLALAGVLSPMSGRSRIVGSSETAGLAARARAGMSLITEERSVFQRLTVADNLRLGRGRAERALEIFPELVEHQHRRAGHLSGGQQQMLALGRALAGMPRVLLADELSLGLAPKLVRRLLAEVRAAAQRGTAVVLVEQQAARALSVADRAIVLRGGRCVMDGRSSELRDRLSEIEAMYLSGGTTAAHDEEDDVGAPR